MSISRLKIEMLCDILVLSNIGVFIMKPNIIFYFSDQQRWDTLNSEIMPNVWELGEEGVLFENSF